MSTPQKNSCPFMWIETLLFGLQVLIFVDHRWFILSKFMPIDNEKQSKTDEFRRLYWSPNQFRSHSTSRESILLLSRCYSSVIGVFLVVPCDNLKSSSLMDFIRGCGDCPNAAFRWSRFPLVDILRTVSWGSAAWSCDRKLASFGGVVPKAPG